MNLQNLSLQNFRNYKKRAFAFGEKTTVISGDNSVGKSNILEAIFLLAAGKSFRAEKDEEMILYGQEFGRVTGQAGETELAVFLSKPKRFFVNDVAKRKMDFVGNFRCVLFRPEDIDLVLGSPSLRREYLNFVLEQVDREYRRCHLSYQKGVRQRNRLLEKIREGEGNRRQLIFWDQLLIRNGDVISQKREEFINFINAKLAADSLNLSLVYDKSVISEGRLKHYTANEIAAGKTLVGPHRDDFKFIMQRKGKAAKDLSIYGSRGEQRMAVLGVKVNELEFIEAKTGERPVLLLDDIFSELDHDHREEVFKLLEKQQTIMTTADEHLIPKRLKTLDIIKL
ncbi:MAG: DNA replication and repair protein RecF [Candidatus Beckwithbacteria bacterium]|nr:DNA replication and repair protein RecF [Candidatus Beckwithbacteria bacterium]